MRADEEDQSGSAGLAALLEHHRSELLRFLSARCGDPDLAQDLLQDMWFKVSGAPDSPIGNGRAYLFRMANNLVLDFRRSRQRAMRRDFGWVDEDGGGSSLPEDRPDPAPSADAELAKKQEAELLHRVIAGLPPGAQRALRLHRLEGYPQAEVAEIMGISRSGVEKHLAVAMKHLKNALADCGYLSAVTSQQQGLPGGQGPQPESRR